MGTLKNLGALAVALVVTAGCEGIGTTAPDAGPVAGLAADALPAAACRNVRGTGQATAGVGGTLAGDLIGTFDVPTDVQTDVRGSGLFLQTQFTDFHTNFGSFTTEDFFVFGPLPAPGESTARFDGRLEVVEGPDVRDGFLGFQGTIAFTVVFLGDQPLVTLVADFDYHGRLCRG